MTPTEKKLFRERIIKEYKLKHRVEIEKKSFSNVLARRFRKIIPFNIVIGIIACIAIIYLKGLDQLIYLLLSGVIWITITSTVISAMLKKEK